jgi:hypothetical protein
MMAAFSDPVGIRFDAAEIGGPRRLDRYLRKRSCDADDFRRLRALQEQEQAFAIEGSDIRHSYWLVLYLSA